MIETKIRAGSAALIVALAAFAAFAAMPGGAEAQGWFDLSRRAPDPVPAPAPSAEVADLSLRIDRLEELVRRLTGEVELLRHRLGESGPVAEYPASQAPASAPEPYAASAPGAAQASLAPPAAPVPQAAPQMSYEEAVRAFNNRASSEYGGQTGAALGHASGQINQPTSLLPPGGGSGAQPVLGAPEHPLGTIPASALRGGSTEPPPAYAASQSGGPGQSVASLDSAVIEEAYSQAYSLLIAEDYAGAETAFQTFIARYPGHELAGNAQYWLAESFYARGDYRRAAQEFLAGYETYGSSTKAPDSLLKLGMTLAALGQNEQACASFGEIAGRFPNADPAIIERARSERGRVGC